MSEQERFGGMSPEQAQAFARLIEAAEAGSGDAACRLGDMYREGLGGLGYSPKQTFCWYARSAMAGDANGQNNLGACYEHALGCAQSYAKAAKWYWLAAAQQLSTANMNLGYCYLRGHGVPRDAAEALRLFRLAVAGGEDRAAQEVEKLERENGPRVSEPAPAGTPSTPPWGLARRVPRRDGPPDQLQHRETTVLDRTGATDGSNPLDTRGDDEQSGTSAVRIVSGIRFVPETPFGRNLGISDVGGVLPPEPGVSDEGPTPHEEPPLPSHIGRARTELDFALAAQAGRSPEDVVAESADQ